MSDLELCLLRGLANELSENGAHCELQGGSHLPYLSLHADYSPGICYGWISVVADTIKVHAWTGCIKTVPLADPTAIDIVLAFVRSDMPGPRWNSPH